MERPPTPRGSYVTAFFATLRFTRFALKGFEYFKTHLHYFLEFVSPPNKLLVTEQGFMQRDIHACSICSIYMQPAWVRHIESCITRRQYVENSGSKGTTLCQKGLSACSLLTPTKFFKYTLLISIIVYRLK
jgi:hypothetical protein